MTKKRKRPGYSLFIERMKREGRYNVFKEYYDGFIKDGRSPMKATYQACMKTGYDGPDAERKLDEEHLEKEMSAERKEAHDAEMRANELEELDINDVKRLSEYNLSESDLPEEIAWVYHSLHKCKGDRDEWFVASEEAPSPGAWSMLCWAVDNTGKFMEIVIKEELKLSSAKDDDQSMRATEHSIDVISQLLNDIGGGHDEKNVGIPFSSSG